MSLHDDVILRALTQLVEALLRAAGLRRRKDLPAAEQALGEGLRSLGLPLELLGRMDPATLTSLVPEPAKRALLAAALVELARLREVAGRVDEADELRDRAEVLDASIDMATLPELVRAARERLLTER